MYFYYLSINLSHFDVHTPLHRKVYTKSVLKCTCNSTITLQGVNLPEYGLPMEITNLHQISAEKQCQLCLLFKVWVYATLVFRWGQAFYTEFA